MRVAMVRRVEVVGLCVKLSCERIDLLDDGKNVVCQALLADLQKSKPASSKGVYLRKVTVSSTMGPGVPVDQSSLTPTAA